MNREYFRLLCKRGSASSRIISEACGIRRTFWLSNIKLHENVGWLINWGLFGEPARKYYAKQPIAEHIATLNGNFPGNNLKWQNRLRRLILMFLLRLVPLL